MGINKMQSNGDGNKNGLIPVTTLEPSAPESLLKLMQKEMSKSLWMQKG
jgi:hypothetical protein